MPGRTLFAKIWDAHVVADLGDNACMELLAALRQETRRR
jgi:hypothetical protein